MVSMGVLTCALLWSDHWVVNAPGREGLTQEVRVEVCDGLPYDYGVIEGMFLRVMTRLVMGEAEVTPWVPRETRRVRECEGGPKLLPPEKGSGGGMTP